MMMGGNWRFLCACLCALFAAGFSEPIELDLQQHCNTTISTFSSALLTVNSWWWAGPGDCNVRIHADHSYSNQVRLEVLDLQAPCQNLSITLFDGPDSEDYNVRPTKRPMSPMLCDEGWRQEETMYLTTADTLTITLHPGRDLDLSRGSLAVKLLATSTSTAQQYGDFQCDNMFNVIDELKCDGYNNCGDQSDEGHHLCHHWRHWRAHKIGIIAGSSAAGVLIIVLVVVFIVRRRRRQTNGAPTTSGNARNGPPPYKSIQ